jgi:hypothetical protein
MNGKFSSKESQACCKLDEFESEGERLVTGRLGEEGWQPSFGFWGVQLFDVHGLDRGRQRQIEVRVCCVVLCSGEL